MQPNQQNQAQPTPTPFAPNNTTMPIQPASAQPMASPIQPASQQPITAPIQPASAPAAAAPIQPASTPVAPMASSTPSMPNAPQTTGTQTAVPIARNAAQPATAGQQQQQQQTATGTKHDNPNSTQSSLLISELRDSMVIMKDGSFRAVIACKSINFDLMSSQERDGVEAAYQGFLNSLDFTIQILVRSQRIDITPYIERLAAERRKNDNMLLGVMMDNYIDFIDALSQEANIMDKSFFIVIPYYTSKEAEKALEQSRNFFKTFTKDKTPPVTRIDRNTYDKAVAEINARCETILSGLFDIGIQAVRLNTNELGQLYYNFNNPDTAVNEPLGDFNKLARLYVRKGESEDQKGENN